MEEEEEDEEEEDGEKEDEEDEEEEEYERRGGGEGNDYDTRSEAGDSRSASSVSFSDDGESVHSGSASDASGNYSNNKTIYTALFADKGFFFFCLFFRSTVNCTNYLLM